MEIAIISDSSMQEHIDTMLKKFTSINMLNLNYVIFNTKIEFQNFIDQQNYFPFKIIVMIQSNKQPDLFQLASNIKRCHPKCEIIFSSKNPKFAIEGYKIDLSFYLLQPFTYEDFAFALNKCLKNFIYGLKYITVNSNWQKINIELNQIQFAEKLGHNVIIKTENKTISTRCTFAEFLKKFQDNTDFINCVKGALVNLNWVKSIEPQNFLMQSGDRISIRRQDRKKIKQIYNNFLIQKQNETFTK